MFRSPNSTRHLGYTLIEVVVVLVLLAVATTVVAPSLLAPRQGSFSSAPSVIKAVREAAVRRGQLVRLQVDRTGSWRAIAGASSQGELLLTGRLANPRQSATDILFSPLGTCAPTPESTPSEEFAGLDPLTCEVRVK